MMRVALLAALAALALSAAAPAEAAGAPRVGRWVGVTKHGINVSFTIHAVGGRRYIANEVALCGTSGFAIPLAASLGPAFPASQGWLVGRGGRIRLLSGQPETSPFRGRLGRTTGLIHLFSSRCPEGPLAEDPSDPARTWAARVRWVPGRPVESGEYEMSGPFVLGGNVTVIGSAALWSFGGHLGVPSVPPPSFGFEGCPLIVAFQDAWIQPGGSFSADDDVNGGGNRAEGRIDGEGATGAYRLRFSDPACVTAPQPFTARLVKSAPPPRAGRLVLPPPIPGAGSQPPSGPCGRPTTVTVRPVAAISCFRDRGGVKVSATTVRLNGIDVVPGRGVEVRLDTRTARLTTTGPAEVQLPFGPYGTRESVPITRGVLDWNLRKAKGFDVRGRTAEIGELRVTGSAELRFQPGAARGKVSVELPEVLGGFSGDVAVRASNERGVLDDGVNLQFKGAVVERLGLQEASLTLSRTPTGAFHWDGKAAVELQRDRPRGKPVDLETLELIVELGIGPGDGYFRLAGGLDGINRQVYRGIFLQRLGLSGQRNPVRFGGNIGFSAGPQIDTKIFGKLEAASVDGTYELDLGTPLCYQGTGKGRLVIGDLFDTRFRMCSNGLVEGDYGVRLTPLLLFGFGLEGRLRGWIVQNRAFNLEGNPKIDLPGPDGTGNAVVSSTGIGACLRLGPSVGWGYRWGDRRPTFMARSCGIGPWQAARPQTARAAVAGQAFTVRRGQRVAVFSAVGTSAAPAVTLTGPGGERVTATAAGFADARFRAVQDPIEHVSYFAVAHPTPGRWQLTPEPGSAPVSAFRSAAPRPTVRIRARVRRGPHGTRRLVYRVAGLAGGRVRFEESGADVRRVLGITRRARGALRFRPSPGRGARRSIVAAVVRDGIPEPARRVALFSARTPRAAPPRRVRVRAQGLRRVITWSGPRDRAYRVLVRTSDGRRLLFLPDRRHRVTVRPVLRGTRLRATVRALDRLGRPGLARTAWSPPRRKLHRRAPKPCAAAIAHASC